MPIFVGDVHGKFSRYKAIIKEHKDTIQVGDMGIGFRRWPHGEYSQNPPYDEMVKANAQFIRGNHDNPAVCRKHSQYIADGRVHNDMMFIGGAYSIDWQYRTEDFSWWRDEECSPEQFKVLHGIYTVTKPACMVTHDCPKNIYPMLHTHHWNDPARTPVALQAMWEVHKPKLWVFGHHHKSFDMIVDGTRFVCLAELEVKELNWEK
jgi:hypothetical protein